MDGHSVSSLKSRSHFVQLTKAIVLNSSNHSLICRGPRSKSQAHDGWTGSTTKRTEFTTVGRSSISYSSARTSWKYCPALNPDLRKSSERLHSGGYNCRKCMVVLSEKSGCVLTVYGTE